MSLKREKVFSTILGQKVILKEYNKVLTICAAKRRLLANSIVSMLRVSSISLLQSGHLIF